MLKLHTNAKKLACKCYDYEGFPKKCEVMQSTGSFPSGLTSPHTILLLRPDINLELILSFFYMKIICESLGLNELANILLKIIK